jgi:hypothetical protein
MGVLLHVDPSDCVTIIAGINLDWIEALSSRLLRAALVDAPNAVHNIIFHVPGPVELCIANRIGARIALANHRNLVINVQMLSAAHLTLASHTTAVTGHHIGTIGVTFVMAITEMILTVELARRVVVNRNLTSRLIDALNIRPLPIVVNLRANSRAVLVICLTCHVDAILRTTLGEKLLLGVIMEEDIKVAFNLLGGRPIDLTVLLQALLLMHMFSVLVPALLLALLVID